MNMINFKSFSLIDKLKLNDNGILECISEANSNGTQNYKCLMFQTKVNQIEFKVKFFLQDNENEMFAEVLLENVCKNFEISDDEMDIVINKLKVKTQKIKEYLEENALVGERANNSIQNLKLDTVLGDLKQNVNIDNDKLKVILNEFYLELKPQKLEIHNYLNEILLFGKLGKNVAKVIESLEIASYRRTRSGYLLSFNDDLVTYSNTFSHDFAERLSKLGVSTLVAPLDILELSW